MELLQRSEIDEIPPVSSAVSQTNNTVTLTALSRRDDAVMGWKETKMKVGSKIQGPALSKNMSQV